MPSRVFRTLEAAQSYRSSASSAGRTYNPGMRIGPALLALGLTLPLSGPVRTTAQSGSTMQAVRVHAFGGVDALQVERAPRPSPGQGEVLIRVRAAGVNPVDAAIRAGRFGNHRDRLPLVPGVDVSGTIAAMGAGVEDLAVGDRVFGMLELQRTGTYAEYVVAKRDEVARMPAALDFPQAAGVPLVALTAQQALFDTARLRAGETVLIQGASGGVGSYAIQLAKAAGARVIGVAGPDNQAYMRQLGADVTVDYSTQRIEDVARDVDVVLDTVGGDTQARSFTVLKRGGRLVSLVGPPSATLAAQHGVEARGILVHPSRVQLEAIARLFDDRQLVAAETTVLPLADVRVAHERIASRHTRGKIVLVP